MLTHAEKQEARLAGEVQSLLEQELKPMWTHTDRAFIAQIAADLAREKMLALTAADAEEHERNLKHLAATVQGELMRREIGLGTNARRTIGRVLSAVIHTVAMSALGVR